MTIDRPALPNDRLSCKLSDRYNSPNFDFAMTRFFSALFGRALWIRCHVYLALCLGLVFALIGLTGSLSIYRDALDELLNPSLVIKPTQPNLLALDNILALVRQSEPNRHGVWILELPRKPSEPLTAWFEKPSESVDKTYAPLMLAINPYTGEILAKRFWGETFSTWLLDLHSRLQWENDGRALMAMLAILLSLSVISGLYLWWPTIAGLKNAFRIHYRGSLMRFLLEMHRLIGVISAGLLLLLAFTGFHLAYPELLEKLTASQGMGHGDQGPTIRSTAVPNNHPVSIAEAILVARGLFPHSEVRRISTPLGDLGTYRINLRQKDELNQHHPFTTVWVDRWSGQIRGVNNPRQFSAGQTFTTWQWPLHTGEAFGNTGRFVWFIAGLMPMMLWVSGMAHWLQRKNLLKDQSIDLPRDMSNLIVYCRRIVIRQARRIWERSVPLMEKTMRWLRTHLQQLNSRF